MKPDSGSEKSLRINMTIEGQLAEWLEDWESKGFVASVADAVRQSLVCLHEKFLAIDERSACLRTLTNELDS